MKKFQLKPISQDKGMNLFNRRKDRCEEYTVEIKPRDGKLNIYIWCQSGRQYKYGPSVVKLDDHLRQHGR